MKKLFILLLVLVVLAVPVSAFGNLIQDDSGLLTDTDVQRLEEIYGDYPKTYGFTPALVTTDSFGGLSAEEFAGQYYDLMEYPEDGIQLLVSLEEGEWYILTNGACYRRISDWDADAIGQEILPLIQNGEYYAAFLRFPEIAAEYFEANADKDVWEAPEEIGMPQTSGKNYGKTVAISMAVGLVIGLIAVGIMALRMKTVRSRHTASDYVRPGSMELTNQRDIFLYSHVSRTPRPKSTSSGGSSGGGSRGGAGGKI